MAVRRYHTSSSLGMPRKRGGKTTSGKWSGPEFAKSQLAVEYRDKMEGDGGEVICGAPTTLRVKGEVRVR